MITQTANPVLGVFGSAPSTFDVPRSGIVDISRPGTMTIQGTAIRTVLLSVLMGISFVINWQILKGDNPGLGYTLGSAGSFIGFILGMIISFWPTGAPFLSPLYALCQGCILSLISCGVELRFPGLAGEAAGLTIITVMVMGGLYWTRIIRVNDTFRACVTGATSAVFFYYMIGFVLSWFGIHMPGIGFNVSLLSLGISLVVVVVAAFNLALDFDMIEQGSGSLPQSYEWYGAFGLLVTIIWLYVEILRLLMIIASYTQERR